MVEMSCDEGPRDGLLVIASEHGTPESWTTTGLAPRNPLLLVSGAEEARGAGENFQLESIGGEEQPSTDGWGLGAVRSPLSKTSSSSEEVLEGDNFGPNKSLPAGI